MARKEAEAMNKYHATVINQKFSELSGGKGSLISSSHISPAFFASTNVSPESSNFNSSMNILADDR